MISSLSNSVLTKAWTTCLSNLRTTYVSVYYSPLISPDVCYTVVNRPGKSRTLVMFKYLKAAGDNRIEDNVNCLQCYKWRVLRETDWRRRLERVECNCQKRLLRAGYLSKDWRQWGSLLGRWISGRYICKWVWINKHAAVRARVCSRASLRFLANNQ